MRWLGSHVWDRLTAAPQALVACHIAADGSEISVCAADLQRAAMAVRRALERLPLPDRALIGIVHKSGPMLHAGWLGALWAGHIPTMVAPPSPRMEARKYAEGFASIGNHLGIEALVMDGETRTKLGDMMPDLPLVVTDAIDSAVADDRPPPPRDADEEAVVQHTSGTTGLQKAIGFTSAQIFTHADVLKQCCLIDDDDRIATWLPLYHDMGFIACFVTPLVLGVPIYELSPFEWVARPALLLETMARHRATLTWLPNFAFKVMSGERMVAALPSGMDLSHVKAFISCSEPVLAESISAFTTALAPFGVRREQVIASYAMAENLFLVSQNPIGRPRETRFDRAAIERESCAIPRNDGIALVSNGRAAPTTRIAIRRDGIDLAEGQVGEIWIAGTHLFHGYRKLDAGAVLRDGWYNTGDLGFLWDGDIHITGRAKDLIIIRGRNYYPHDIETLVSEVDGVAPGRVAAFGVSDPVSGTEKLVLMIELAENRDADRSAILLAIRQAVAQNLDTTIGDIRVMPPRGLVKSTAGKVARSENRKRYLELTAGS